MKKSIILNGKSVILSAVCLGSFTNVWEGDKLSHYKFRVYVQTENGRTWFNYFGSYADYCEGVTDLGEEGLKNALYCFLSDASSFVCCYNFIEFCDEFGYDTDSVKARKIYDACGRYHQRATKLFGEDYTELINVLDC